MIKLKLCFIFSFVSGKTLLRFARIKYQFKFFYKATS